MDITNPVKAIRQHCLNCCCGSTSTVRECPAKTCALYPFRMGVNPYRKKREYTDEQKEELKQRLNGGQDESEA